MRARIISIVLCLFALAIPAVAAERRGAPSLDRVLPHIRQSVPGTFYDAEGPFLSPNGQASYRIKWMTPDGRIVWFAVDARSGQILGGAPASRNRYRGDDDYRGSPRFGEDDGPSRYRDRDSGWDSRPYRRNDDDDDQRYGRSQERGPARGPERNDTRNNERSRERRPDRGSDGGPDRGNDRGRGRPPGR